jgi:hypothetical protein
MQPSAADEGGDTQSDAAVRTPQSLRGAYTRHLHALPAGNLERDQQFSWLQAFLSLFSYTLMLTDVLRTGLGIDRLPYRSLEPDAFAYFGPLAYVTTHLTTQNATASASLPFWTYKYDTTSMGMRTVAHFFSLQEWPVCVTYAQPCDESQGIPLPSVFAMVESIVHAVGSRAPDQAVTLRSHHAFKDRVYHYALPWFFNALKTRTTHAVHFAHPLPLHSICADRRVARRPYSCSQSWTNTRRLTCEDETQCEALGVWDSIHARQQHLARAYADHEIDFVVLDAMEDFPRGSLTYQGRKDIDIVVLTRIRQCSAGHCETVAVDDYRYETATFVMNALDWYTIVGLLRVVGQAYVWLRLFSLVVGCAFARLGEPRFEQATFVARLIVSARTVFLIPSQVVVYGSSFPVSCYVLAHWIDSPAAYAMVQAYFTSLLGKMHWTLSDLLQHCAVSMRTVWVIGFICHRLLALATRTRWSPIHGVPGMAEIAITLIASLTIVAQFRALSFRRATVESVLEVVPSARRAQFRADRYDDTRSAFRHLIGGSPIDFQCLLCGFLCLLGASVLVGMLRRAFPRLLPLRLTLTSTTITPYSAGMIWPRNRLVVSWHGGVVNVEVKKKKAARYAVAQAVAKPPLSTASATSKWYHKLLADERGMVLRETTASRLVQRDMQSIDRRPREIDATVFLMNAAAMTDLLTWLDLRVLDGKLIGLYETKAGNISRRCLLLPYGLEALDADIPIDWDALELIAVVNSRDLAWPDLLRCG